MIQATVNSPAFTTLSLSGNALDAEAAKAIQGALAQPRYVEALKARSSSAVSPRLFLVGWDPRICVHDSPP